MYHYFYTSELIEKDVAALVPMPKLHEKEIIRLDPDEVATLLELVENGEELTETEKKVSQSYQNKGSGTSYSSAWYGNPCFGMRRG